MSLSTQASGKFQPMVLENSTQGSWKLQNFHEPLTIEWLYYTIHLDKQVSEEKSIYNSIFTIYLLIQNTIYLLTYSAVPA